MQRRVGDRRCDLLVFAGDVTRIDEKKVGEARRYLT